MCKVYRHLTVKKETAANVGHVASHHYWSFILAKACYRNLLGLVFLTLHTEQLFPEIFSTVCFLDVSNIMIVFFPIMIRLACVGRCREVCQGLPNGN